MRKCDGTIFPTDYSLVPIEDDDGNKGIGILFFRKWEEERENFPTEFLEYMTQLDEGEFIDYGRVVKSDISDPDEISLLKRISNYTQAVNNTLFEVPIKPPFYYLATPLMNREYGQYICDMVKETYDVDSLFFSFPIL